LEKKAYRILFKLWSVLALIPYKNRENRNWKNQFH
jgi:hypothetical protein